MANKTEMDHFSHEHPLILNEVYIARKGDVCRGCNQEIVSCRSFVYTCSNTSITDSKSSSSSSSSSSCVKFLLHKSCAELPPTIKHPNHDDVSLSIFSWKDYEFYSGPGKHIRKYCRICHDYYFRRGFIYDTTTFEVGPVCIRCGMESLDHDVLRSSSSSIYHPGHPQHPLEFVGHLSSFRCHACKVDDNIRDLSYICTKCSLFWIHKSCADAPASFQFHFHHKHPLQLSFSLPQVYQKFYQYCRICRTLLRSRDWLYYCPKCRFFAHFHCARSNEKKIRLIEDEKYDDSEVVHLLPAADESSADQLAEQFVMAMSTVITTNCFRHWAHKQHDLQLMTINELNINQKHDDEEALLLLCDACVKPIRTDQQDNQFYGCVPCNYFMHNACAGFPREIEHHLRPGITLYADKYSSPLDYFYCDGCGIPTNGIAFHDGKKPLSRYNNVYIGCLTLPKKIKHEAHNHQLNQVISTKEHEYCKACGVRAECNRYKYCCEKCGYYICARCIMQPKTIKHPWDPHPLSLIYDPGMLSSDHEHEFECEYCSQEIDTNFWFYHCSECDLSFHLLDYIKGRFCFEWSRHSFWSNIKFGATVIIDKLHHHSLTFVYNKKVRWCQKCFSKELLGRWVLECVPCKAIFCWNCWNCSSKEYVGRI